MKKLARLRSLTPERRRAVTRASLLLGAVQVGLAVMPFQRLLNTIYRAAKPADSPDAASSSASQFDMDLAVWAVEAAGRRLLSRNPCLPKALAMLIMLRRAGEEAQLRLGVAREGEGPLQAHAWVESQGVVVMGGDVPLDDYTPLGGLEVRNR